MPFAFARRTSQGATFGGLFKHVAWRALLLLALVHKLSHERPGLVFWMPRNSHRLHHGKTPRHNFGIVTRFWDRVFGTYADRPDLPVR